jgi:hypothetical protein
MAARMVAGGCKVAADIGETYIQTNGCVEKCEARMIGIAEAGVDCERRDVLMPSTLSLAKRIESASHLMRIITPYSNSAFHKIL